MENSVTKKDCDINVKTMTDKIDKLKDKMNDIEKTVIREIAELPNILESKFDNRYANKATENTVNKVIWLVIAGVIIGILNLVLK